MLKSLVTRPPLPSWAIFENVYVSGSYLSELQEGWQIACGMERKSGQVSGLRRDPHPPQFREPADGHARSCKGFFAPQCGGPRA